VAEELLTHYRKDISELRLIPASGGCFEVIVNGKVVFSKLERGRFPELKELTRLVDSA
jgi:selenoprotein W-related protein